MMGWAPVVTLQGFTEWTYLKTQKQNRVGEPLRWPDESVGFYCLDDAETRKRQAHQAKYAGIKAFAHYHYWTENRCRTILTGSHIARPVMERAILKMLDDAPEDSIQHLLVWANISWTNKWDGASEVLLPQTYGDETEWENHFQFLLKFWSHPKAFRVDNKIAFGFYHPSDMGWGLFDTMVKFFRRRLKEELVVLPCESFDHEGFVIARHHVRQHLFLEPGVHGAPRDGRGAVF